MKRRNTTPRRSVTCQPRLETLQNRSLMAADIVTAGAMDFGDAPDTYGTTLENDGARHVAVTSFAARNSFWGWILKQ